MIKNYEQIKQKKIDAAIEAKVKRMSMQQISINVSWSINCALASFSEEEKKDWEKEQNKIRGRSNWFRELYQDIMMEEIPIVENPPLENTISAEQAAKQEEGKKWQEKYNTMRETEEINSQLQEVSEEQKEI